MYELQDTGDKPATEIYKQAVWVFKTAVWDNDDFLEEAECLEVMERVARGEAWAYLGLEEDRNFGRRARARGYRVNWCVNLGGGETRSSGPRT